MYFPLAWERVWVSGCPHEFIVLTANYSDCVATLAFVEDRKQVKCCPFHQLFQHSEFHTSQVHNSVREERVHAMDSSRSLIRACKDDRRELREIIRSTQSTIRKSKELIAQTDRIVARWKTLGCEP
jgi:hypothetical protein